MGNPLKRCPGCGGYVVLIMERDPVKLRFRNVDPGFYCRRCCAINWKCAA
jgi:hypothetical protein